MRSHPDSFWWSEDFDGVSSFWVWLHRQGDISDRQLIQALRDGLRAAPPRLPEHARAAEFAPVWDEWRTRQIEQQIADSRALKTSTLSNHYQTVAAVGLVAYRVCWVMAPLGFRRLLPPETAVLGCDGASAAERRTAVVEAAAALKG